MKKTILILTALAIGVFGQAIFAGECSSTAECPIHHVQAQATGRCDRDGIHKSCEFVHSTGDYTVHHFYVDCEGD